MRYFKTIIKNNRFAIVSYVAIGIAIAFLSSFSASYFQVVIDRFTEGTLGVAAIAVYGVILIINYILNYIEEMPGMFLKQRIYLELKLQALKKISSIDYQAYQKYGTGALVQRIEAGAEAGRSILFDYYFCLIRQLIPAIVFSLYFIYRCNQIIMLIILAGYVVVFFITNRLLRYLYKVKETILVNEEQMNHYLVRGFMELVVFRINKRFEAELHKTENAQNVIIRNKVKMQMIHEGFFTSFAILVAIVKIMIVSYGWFSKAMTIGEVVALITLVDNAYTPIAIFNVLFVQYKLDCTAFSRYKAFLDEKEDEQLEDGVVLEEMKGAIKVEELGFSYENHTIFEAMNLDIQAGEQVAFVGESGCGKSTLIQLMIGLLKPDSGVIQIDEMPLNQLCLNEFYRNVVYISQESPVFDGSLRENIIFDEKVSDEKLLSVLAKVELTSLVNSLEAGLDTPVGERGITLSGGERQRLALARLWFSPASIVILDEATSAMDNVTEKQVMLNVLNELQGKTVLVIAHRLNTIRDFPRIIVMKDGKILGQGSYKELEETNTYFKQLLHAVRE